MIHHYPPGATPLDPAEIEDALWLTREEMVTVMAGAHPDIRSPRKGAIAHFLVAAWLADRLDDPLVRGFCSQVMVEAREIGARLGIPIDQQPEDWCDIVAAFLNRVPA